ncbi:hypothetical protein XMIN_2286 [Xanthomonas citri pv. mangiferaeindicae LMG 941]|nr:hypothetical protein XMIN_2286 [Xanthomonas citri pv. mangiferaeindicae LMG 941]
MGSARLDVARHPVMPASPRCDRNCAASRRRQVATCMRKDAETMEDDSLGMQ